MAKKKESKIELEVQDTKYNLEDLKNELKDYITLEIRKEYNEEIEKVNRRLIKEKNKSLLSKNIVIVILILIMGFLLYLMYNDGYFNRLFNKEEKNKTSDVINDNEDKKQEENNEKQKDEQEKKEEKKPTLDELKKEYEYLLENIYINEESVYLNDYYQGVLSSELKNYLALNLVDFVSLNKEDDYNIIDSDTLKMKYNKLFNDIYKGENFEYNGNKIRYINKIDSYITSSLLEKKKTNIKRDIINITVDGKKIVIETIEGIVKDDGIYNILTNEKIEENKELSQLKEKLTHMIYTFDGDILISLSNSSIE